MLRSRRKRRYLAWAATIAFWIASFIATHIPAQRLPDVRVNDKTVHFIAYFILAALLYISTRLTNPARTWLGATVIAIAMIYGAIDELLQPLVGRNADMDDWLYDVAGATCAVFLLAAIRRIWNWYRTPARLHHDQPAESAREPEHSGV